ncbi:MAG TPA: pyridoxamine 5'-phosphate oxidase family protein [Acidimicrobiia bacterium]|jgi:PPOX class probable F420-dependent enzyme|nr:pyridoxamine 5'-phosphate oxidase family protein [Acidimicrobiia bacterium]
MNREERRAFVNCHRTAIFGYGRQKDGPAMTIVYYVADGDDILVSTMAERAKAKAVARHPKVSLCVLDEQWPPTYLQVYCDATVETDLDANVDLAMRIAGLMAGEPMPDEVRPLVADGVRKENRVVLRLTPYATFETPSRHVHSADDVNENLVHELGTSLAW